MSFVTTQPEMLAWTTENLQVIGWPTAALVGQRDPSGSVAVLIVGQEGDKPRGMAQHLGVAGDRR
jgi:hypothetical protein